MAGMVTPSKVEQEVSFQPTSYPRDGTPRRAMQQSEYERRKDVCTSHFLQKLHSDIRQRESKVVSSLTTARSTDLRCTRVFTAGLACSARDFANKAPKYLGAAVLGLVPLLAVIIALQFTGHGPTGTSRVSWATVFPGDHQADWSFGCHLKNITKDREAGLVSFTAEFTDLPANAFAAESFQVGLGAVFQQQVSELGDYSFSTSEVSINLSQTEASIDTNVTFAEAQELIVFVGKLTTGALAGRLADNRAFRRVMTDAGYAPTIKSGPAAIKGTWMEPMVEDSAKYQEEAAHGLLGYMYKVQQSYDEVRKMLMSSETRQANLTEEVQSKSAALNQAQLKLAKLQKDLDKTYGELESAKKGGDDLKQWQIEAKEQLKALSSEVSTLRKYVSKKEKVLEDLQRQHQGLQVMHKDTQEKLQSYQVNKSQLVEMRDALAKDKAASEKQLSAVATKLAKILLERFNVTSPEGATADALVGALGKELRQWSADSRAGVQKVQAEVAELKLLMDTEIAKRDSELTRAEGKFKATLSQQEKEAAAALAAAESSTAKAVESATEQLKADVKGLEKKIHEADKLHANLQSKLDAAQKQLAAKNAVIEELQKKSKSSAEEIAVLNKELRVTVRAKESLQTKVNTLEGDLSTCNSLHKETAKTVEQQEMRITRLEHMVFKTLQISTIFEEVAKDYADYKRGAPKPEVAASETSPTAAAAAQ